MNDPLAKPLIIRFGKREEIFFAKRLGMILRSGLPLLEAMEMLVDETSSASAVYVYRSLIAHVTQGRTLSAGMRSLKPVFGDFAVSMVQVGESSGGLHENVRYLADELKKKDALKKKVLGALVYPAVILVATLCISIGLVMYLFPKIIPIFKSLGHDLPWSTRAVVFVSNLLIKDGWEIAIVCVFAMAISAYLLRRPLVRTYADSLVLRTPVFGALVRAYNLSNIARTLSNLLNGGMRIVPALRISAACCGHSLYRHAFECVAADVEHGRPLSTCLKSTPHLFPPLFVQMILVGERTGNLAGSLKYLSEVYEEDLADLTRTMTTLLEPLLMIGMGVVVGFIAISIITPIYGITQNINAYR